ncbi:ribonuclease H-like domain-containing protein [Tanacetum coccineum]
MKNSLKQTVFESSVTKDLNHKNLFDNENPKRHNDEGRMSSNDDGTKLNHESQGNDNFGATSIEENNTHLEGNAFDETYFVFEFYEKSEFNYENDDLPVNNVRRYSRHTKLPASLNEFVINDKVKYVNIKDLGSLKYFLGIEVIKTDNDICLSQRKYCLELLKEYGLLGCKPVSTQMEPNYVLSYIPTDTDPLLDNIIGYQKLLGKLIYLTHTRPDIAYSVHYLAQYMHSPLQSYLYCALNVLRYLKNAPSKGIKYAYSNYENNLKGYSDADWAKCLKTRKSVTRYCVFFNNCLISWKSKRKNTLSKSFIEYRAMSSAAYEIICIQKLSKDLNVKVTLPLDSVIISLLFSLLQIQFFMKGLNTLR